jgi:hypothetical protein
MKWALKNVGHTLLADPCVGFLLEEYDADADDGVGRVVWTPDPNKALLFDDMLDAMGCWKQISGVVATRWDGKPNRPLTAWSVMPIKMEADDTPVS